MHISPVMASVAKVFQIPIRSARPMAAICRNALQQTPSGMAPFSTTSAQLARKKGQAKPDKRISMWLLFSLTSRSLQSGWLILLDSIDPLPPAPPNYPDAASPTLLPQSCPSALDHSPCMAAIPCKSQEEQRAGA